MNKQILTVSIFAAVITLASCHGDAKKDEGKAALNAGFDLANMDTTVKPTDNFYQYVDGNWIKNNPIPQSESRWGSFNEFYEKNTAKLRVILEEAVAEKSAKQGSNTQKIGDFYSLAMDSVKLNKDGASPLKEEFDAIDKIMPKHEYTRLREALWRSTVRMIRMKYSRYSHLFAFFALVYVAAEQ